MAKLCEKPISPREGARKKKNHGGRENKLYPVFLEVPIGKREMIEAEATKIYEAARTTREQGIDWDLAKRKTWGMSTMGGKM